MADGAPRVERDGDVVRITMVRAARRNALSREHLTQLLAAVTEAGASDAAGIVLAGEGPVFSAGHDFADVAGKPVTEVRSLLRLCTDLMQAVQDVPQVVVARVFTPKDFGLNDIMGQVVDVIREANDLDQKVPEPA